MVLSSEEFIRFGGRRGVPAKRTTGLLSDFSPESIHIVCYLRRPDRYLESWYNQLIKLGGSPLRLSESLDRYIGSVHVQFFDAVAYWAHLPGVTQLTLRRYDEVRDSLLESTLNAVGVPEITRVEKRSEPTADVNPRIPDAFVEFARVFKPQPQAEGSAPATARPADPGSRQGDSQHSRLLSGRRGARAPVRNLPADRPAIGEPGRDGRHLFPRSRGYAPHTGWGDQRSRGV